MKPISLALAFLGLGLSIMACAAAAPTSTASQRSVLPAATAAPAQGYGALPAAPPAPGVRDSKQQANVPNAASEQRMIVYTAQLNLEVQDTDKAVGDISAIVAQYKGYIAATQMSRDSEERMAGSVTLRIPAESLDAAQKQIENIGLRVLSRNRNSNDVTDQFTDYNARLTNLQATEIELRQLLDTVREKTGKADDILAIYNRLTEIRGQIEQIKGQMNVLSQTSAYATLTVQLTPHVETRVVGPESWLPNETARQALRSLVQALQVLANLGIWLVLFLLPFAIVFLLPFAVLALILRSLWRRRQSKKTVAPA
jgi:hypothetical protein